MGLYEMQIRFLMKKAFFFLVFIIVCNEGYSQTKDTIKEKNSSFIGLMFYPGISNLLQPPLWFDYEESQFKSTLSFSGGINIFMETKKNGLFIETGLLLFKRDIKEIIIDHAEVPPKQIREQSDIGYYLTVPFSVLIKKQWFYYGGGVDLGYFIKRKIRYDNGETQMIPYPRQDMFSSARNLMPGIHIKTGIAKEIYKNLAIRNELFFNVNVGPRYIYYGLGLGLNYKIN